MQVGRMTSNTKDFVRWMRLRTHPGQLLDELLGHFDFVYVVLNALNECGEVSKIGRGSRVSSITTLLERGC